MRSTQESSAKEFFRIYPEIKLNIPERGKLWVQSDFVETMGNTNEDIIRAYD